MASSTIEGYSSTPYVVQVAQPHQESPGALPMTGLDTGLFLVAAVILTTLGMGLRKLTNE